MPAKHFMRVHARPARSIFSKGGGGDIDYKAGRAWRGYGVAHSGPL